MSTEKVNEKYESSKFFNILITGLIFLSTGVTVASGQATISSRLQAQLISSSSKGNRDMFDTRRRLKRSVDDPDYRAFRNYIMRENRLGGSAIMKRDSSVILLERTNTRSTIAAKVECGECKVERQMVPIRKAGCRTKFVFTNTCMGMCETWEIPDINPPFSVTHHRVCKPTQLKMDKIRLTCKTGVNPIYLLPVALNCACTKCNPKNTACKPLF